MNFNFYISDNCDNVSDYKYLTISMNAMKSIMTLPLIKCYENLTNRFIESNKIKDDIKENVSAVIKAISFFSHYHYFINFNLISLQSTILKLSQLLIGNVNKTVYFQQFYRLQKVCFITIYSHIILET